MNPDTPQSGKRAGGKSGARTGGAEGVPGPDSTATTSGTNFGDTSAAGASTGSSDVGGASGLEGSDQRQAGRLIDQVKDKATSQMNAQKERATAGLGSVADAVRQTGRQLRDQQHDGVAQVVESAAAQLERFSNHLRNRSLDELVSDAQRLARQQPAIFVGTSFAAGLVAARFIKASSPGRQERFGGTSGNNRNDWRDTSSQTGESVYGTGRPAGSQSSFDTGTGSTSFNTGDRPGAGDVQGRGGF